MLKEEPVLTELFSETEEGTLPHSFYKGSLILILKLDKDNNKKLSRTIPLMNIDIKFSEKKKPTANEAN